MPKAALRLEELAWSVVLEQSERAWLHGTLPGSNCMRQEDRQASWGLRDPRDFGLWCLDQAVAARTKSPRVSSGKFAECMCYGRSDEGLFPWSCSNAWRASPGSTTHCRENG